MKITAFVTSLLVCSAAAFAPSTTERASTSLNMDRRAAFGAIGTAAAFLPVAAMADGAVSGSTVARARGIYGNRIAGLKASVDKGDFGAVAEEKNAFVLFNSGAYPGAKNKSKKAAAVAATNDIFAAIRSGDKGALKSAYSGYVAANDIKPLPAVSNKDGQGYSGDYDYRVGTPAAAIYVR